MGGACDCGQVTYEIGNDAPVLSYACHCLRCQTRSGAAFSQQVFMSESEIKVDGETTSSFRDSNEMRVEEVFCSNCFTRLFNRNTGLPGAVLLYAGTLKESDRLIPIAHIWTSRKQPWVIIDNRITAFAKTPTPEEFRRIMETARSAIFRG